MTPAIPLHDASLWPLRMTRAEVAFVLRRSVRSLERRIEKGLFPSCDVGGTWERAVVERYVKGGIKAYGRSANRRSRVLRMAGGAR